MLAVVPGKVTGTTSDGWDCSAYQSWAGVTCVCVWEGSMMRQKSNIYWLFLLLSFCIFQIFVYILNSHDIQPLTRKFKRQTYSLCTTSLTHTIRVQHQEALIKALVGL
jgi:hypothetical protein